MKERYFIIKPEARVSRDMKEYCRSVLRVENALNKLSEDEGIEGSLECFLYPNALGINPSENDIKKFSSQLRKYSRDGYTHQFKKNSDIGEKWAKIVSDIQPRSAPILWTYYVSVFNREAEIDNFVFDDVAYCVIKDDVGYDMPDDFIEITKKDYDKAFEKVWIRQRFALNIIGIPTIEDGDKIRLNLELIRSHPDYPSLSAKYTHFVESNADTVFTAKVEHGTHNNGLISLQEDQTGWLFWPGFLIKESV